MLNYNKEFQLKPKAVAVHFNLDFFVADFFNSPGLFKIQDLLQRSRQGILFPDLEKKTKKNI
jgi:hypothetical protein